MKPGKIYLSIFFALIASGIYSQTIELGTSFISSNAPFYKNVFGIGLGFNYDFNKQYILAEIRGTSKKNSYSQVAPDLVDGTGYVMKDVDGTMQNISIRTGIAQKIFNSEKAGVSFGAYISLNFFRLQEDIHYFYYDPVMNFDHNIHKNDFVMNKIGGGCFIDFELKQVISRNISLFSRCTADIIKYDGRIDGDPFSTRSIYSLGFVLGMKIRLSKQSAES